MGYETALGSPVAAGTMPKSVAVDPTGKYVYVANAGSDNVSMYRIGEYAYVANRSGNNVSMYRIGADDSLTAIGSPVAAGTNPKSVAVDPTGKYVYVANFSSNNISMYRIGKYGMLTDVNAQAGEVPEGFAGIPWGAGRAEVDKAMAARYYPKDSDSKTDVYIYNGEFAGDKADLIFRFINNKVYEGTALFLWHEPNKWRIDQLFSDLKAQLIRKYGKPSFQSINEARVPWNACGVYWTLTGQNTTIDLVLRKQHEYISPNPEDMPHTVTGNVNIEYTNTTLKEQEEKRAKDKDL